VTLSSRHNVHGSYTCPYSGRRAVLCSAKSQIDLVVDDVSHADEAQKSWHRWLEQLAYLNVLLLDFTCQTFYRKEISLSPIG